MNWIRLKALIKWFAVAAGIVMGLFLGWRVLNEMDWHTMREALVSVPWSTWVPAVAAVFFSVYLQAVRWKLMLPGESVSTTRLFLVRNAGLSINNLIPGRGILGEASELAMLTQGDNIAGGKVAASIFMNRALDFAVSAAFILAGFVVIPQLGAFKSVLVTMVAVAVLLVIAIPMAKKISRLPVLNKFRIVKSALHAIHLLHNRRIGLAVSTSLTIASWLLLGTAAWLVAQALGIALPFWVMSILLVAVSLISGAVPGIPASMGAYEFSTVYMLGFFAITKSDALSFALLVHAMVVAPSLLVGIPVLSREKKAFRGVMSRIGGLSWPRRKHKNEPQTP